MTHLRVKAFKAVWPKISGLIERSYTSAGPVGASAPRRAPTPAQSEEPIDDLSLELEGEPTAAHTASATCSLAARLTTIRSFSKTTSFPHRLRPSPMRKPVFFRPTTKSMPLPKESRGLHQTRLPDEDRRTGKSRLRRSAVGRCHQTHRAAPGRRAPPKPEPKKAKINVDLDTFDQTKPTETIDVPRGDPDALDEIPGRRHRTHWTARGRRRAGCFEKLVPDAYFYQGSAPKNAPRAEDLLDILEALPVAEVVAETIAAYEQQKTGAPAGAETVVAHKSGRFASRVEFQRAPATPMAAIRLGEGEFQKSTLTFSEDAGGEWEWVVASPGPIPVDSFED